MKVLAFGEILWDVINGVEHFGGAPFNFAAHMAQCGHETFMVSRLGMDELGDRAFRKASEHKVRTDFIQRDKKYPTGVVDVTLANGQPDYFIRENTAYDHISDEVVAQISQHRFDLFYFGSLAQRNAHSAKTLIRILQDNEFRHVFYDVNLRKNGFTEDIIHRSLSACTIFKLNEDEVTVVSQMFTGGATSPDAFCRSLKARFSNIKLIIITASEKGCFVYKDTLTQVPGTRVEVADAVGAGDAFSASFM